MDNIREWLESCQNYKRQHGLKRMSALLEMLGNPQEQLACIHVTGTNGKGSTIAFLSQLFQKHGLKSGAFVSPHLVDVTDRFLLDDEAMSEDDFQTVGNLVKQTAESLEKKWGHISFFEAVTAMGFVYFDRKNIDIALIEVGIGGLLDTTNVITPLVSVITTIGMDHQEMLGNTIEAIAIQKTGIIKKKRPVVIGKVPREAQTVAQIVATAFESPYFQQEVDFKILREERGYRFVTATYEMQFDQLGLLGTYQMDNAAVALQTFLMVMDQLKLSPHEDLMQKALAQVTWAGRMEKVMTDPVVILDGAHNLHAMRRLVETMIAYQGLASQTILFAALKRKDYKEMLSYLHQELPNATIVVTTFDYPGAVTESDVTGEVFVPSAAKFVKNFIASAEPSRQLWITGSLYFLSEIRNIFQ